MAHDMIFGIVDNEIAKRMDQLRELDAAYASGNIYPECPRCEGDRMVDAIVRLNGEYIAPTIESFACPLCSGTGEAEAEKAEEWLIEIVEFENTTDEDEKYLEERKKIG